MICMSCLVNPGMYATVVSGVVADPPLAHPPDPSQMGYRGMLLSRAVV
jgi:hypothetical protein